MSGREKSDVLARGVDDEVERDMNARGMGGAVDREPAGIGGSMDRTDTEHDMNARSMSGLPEPQVTQGSAAGVMKPEDIAGAIQAGGMDGSPVERDMNARSMSGPESKEAQDINATMGAATGLGEAAGSADTRAGDRAGS